MRVTVCQMPNGERAFEDAWGRLAKHAEIEGSDLVLLPEMPFFRWLPGDRPGPIGRSTGEWAHAMDAHVRWLDHFPDLRVQTVAATRPVSRDGLRLNEAFVWDGGAEPSPRHHKRYLPDEEGFWEASWYARGDGRFSAFDLGGGSEGLKAGFLICTEMWFTQHARDYGEAGAHLLLCPRATLQPSTDKWIAGGRAAAVVSGAYCLSSNFGGPAWGGWQWGGAGWVVDPEEGDVLGVTTGDSPFLTVDVDPQRAVAAKGTYPRYVST